MEQRWSSYPDNQSDDRQLRHGSSSINTSHQQDRNGLGVRYDAFASPTLPSQPAASTPFAQPPKIGRQLQPDIEGDIPMEDADPFNKQKYEYPIRSTHKSRPPSTQFLPQEESSAARRYSPMDLSPTTPYSTTHAPQSHFSSYTPVLQPNRHSPTRPHMYGSQSYQSSRTFSELCQPKMSLTR